ncbi:TPA: hypothetical protein N0F65_009204, partial [Lagenidium giganteum]
HDAPLTAVALYDQKEITLGGRRDPPMRRKFMCVALRLISISMATTGTRSCGYSTSQELKMIADFYLNSNNSEGLRDRMAHLLCHSCLLRGESARNLELADMFSVMLEKEGYSECRALVFIMNQGKTNKFARLEFGSCIRHNDVSVRSVEPVPNFLVPSEWYTIKLLRGKADRFRPISYTTHYKATVKAFDALKLPTKAKTRGSALQMADLAGASESQIRRLGLWNASTMVGCYLTSLPREVEPLTTLQQMVFPFLDSMLAQYKNESQPNLATGAFLTLLQILRIVVLQVSVCLMKAYPHHRLWRQALFQTPEYMEFKGSLLNAMSTSQPPTAMTI